MVKRWRCDCITDPTIDYIDVVSASECDILTAKLFLEREKFATVEGAAAMMRTRIVELEAALATYGQHHEDCPGSSPHLNCVCGWSRIKREQRSPSRPDNLSTATKHG